MDTENRGTGGMFIDERVDTTNEERVGCLIIDERVDTWGVGSGLGEYRTG